MSETGELSRRDALKMLATAMGGALLGPRDKLFPPPPKERQEFLANHDILQADTSRPIVILTYDDFPKSGSDLTTILDSLKNNRAKAVFFLVGEYLKKLKDGVYSSMSTKDLQRIITDGHEVGLHGWQHITPMTQLTKRQLQEEFEKSLEIFSQVFPNYPPEFYRAPFGSRNRQVLEIAASYNLQHVAWTIGSGGDNNSAENISKGLNTNGNGSIILCHLNRYGDITQADKILDTIKNSGLSTSSLKDGIDAKDRFQNNPLNIKSNQK